MSRATDQLSAERLAALIAAELRELPSEILRDYIAPTARAEMRNLDGRRFAPTSALRKRRGQAQQFWRRLDAYCEAEVLEREEAAS